LLLFFFQAEDGIRDWSVTGVQTCALPIWKTSSNIVINEDTPFLVGNYCKYQAAFNATKTFHLYSGIFDIKYSL